MATINHLAVLIGGRHVADLERTSSGLRLSYDQSDHRSRTAPVSLSLPMEAPVHTGAVVERFLKGLLPESDGALRAIARRHQIDTTDTLDLLSAIGKDCAGAIQFCTAAELEATLNREGHLEECSVGDIEIRLDEMDTDDNASWLMPDEHWSLGGTQQKFALRRQEGRWYIAHGSEATTHLIKPGIRKMRAQALDEHATMRAAGLMGLEVAHTEYTEFESQNAIVITRFDREFTDDGRVVRLHQEDLCQALGNPEKYEEYGGPSAAGIIRFLRAEADSPKQARANVERFVDGLVFNTVVGAPDAHARNHAVMLTGEQVSFAPLYDMATGFAYAPPSDGGRVLSMSIGGTFVLDEVDDDAWRRFAGSARLDEAHVLDRVAELTERAPDAFAEALSEVDDHEGHAGAMLERIQEELTARRIASAPQGASR
ncbi:type II toxin-antitoxin system HipA family toxin [Myceligenerans sp. I2]|uniref:Type II toxin-antitoxin system HipA family toxin n=1 Tax=Myceligenerans indicum TaxID=2593663 RepID=A0ABS1LLB2_9MICO|nr:type II toxin-antitoxin system HipA family toxin [Myceligenerans indicum]